MCLPSRTVWIRTSWNRNAFRIACYLRWEFHYNDVIMSAMAFQITSPIIAYSTVYSGADQIKHQGSASLAFVWGMRRWPVNSPHKGPVKRKMLPLDDVIMYRSCQWFGASQRSCDVIVITAFYTKSVITHHLRNFNGCLVQELLKLGKADKFGNGWIISSHTL